MIVRLNLGIHDEIKENKARFIVIGETIYATFDMFNEDLIAKTENSAKALAYLIHKNGSRTFREVLFEELKKLMHYERNRSEADYEALLEEGEKLLKEFQVQQKEGEEDE